MCGPAGKADVPREGRTAKTSHLQNRGGSQVVRPTLVAIVPDGPRRIFAMLRHHTFYRFAKDRSSTVHLHWIRIIWAIEGAPPCRMNSIWWPGGQRAALDGAVTLSPLPVWVIEVARPPESPGAVPRSRISPYLVQKRARRCAFEFDEPTISPKSLMAHGFAEIATRKRTERLYLILTTPDKAASFCIELCS